ncbi:unnamed protein product [Adineta ricciae]|uniref:Uncharacterized protein n=1 Tax=Adineta ricciae TaxID=249248 RepID=A0A816FSZ0_ADIRI|nr:unnamed protein product [Adineta ricciae]
MSRVNKFRYLELALDLHRNKYEHPRDQLIILVHWTFISRKFQMDQASRFDQTISWTKNEDNSIDIDYFNEDLIIHTHMSFNHEKFFIQMKTDQYGQIQLEKPINDYINENYG